MLTLFNNVVNFDPPLSLFLICSNSVGLSPYSLTDEIEKINHESNFRGPFCVISVLVVMFTDMRV